MTETPETRDEDGREEAVELIARAIVLEDFRQIGYTDVTEDEVERGVAASLVEDGDDLRAEGRAVLDALVAAGWRSPAVVAGLVAEVESRVREEFKAKVLSHPVDLAAVFGYEAGADDLAAVERRLAEANRRLGAVAALADEWEGDCSRLMGNCTPDRHHRRLRAVLAPVSGAVEGAAQVETFEDPWCREEGCQWRHWRSGDMPTHRRGEDCPAAQVAGHEQEVRAEDDGERERWHAVADDIMKHFRSIGSNVSDTYVGLVMSEAWKRRGALSVSAAGHKQEVRGEAIDRFVDAHRKSIDYLLRSADDPVYEDDVAAANHLRSRAGGMSYVVDALVALAARSSGSSAPVQGDEA